MCIHLKKLNMKNIYLLIILIFCNSFLFATNYHVGDGQIYQTISAVPWNTLLPSDNVFIHAKSSPYKEKIVLSQSGTSTNPIRIIGVPDIFGNKPIIDGDSATSQSSNYLGAGQSYTLNTRGLITIAPRPGYTWGYKPSYISIEGLEIKNANVTKSFYEDGILMNYIEFCAGIYADRCENIKIKNCTIHDCGLGIFINSKGDEATQSRHILIEGNHIFNAGVVGSYLEHTTYIEAIDVIYQYNKYGPLIAGALGGALKDRSSGTVIRYNEITAGQRIIDLVNAQSSASFATIDSMYKKTYVYGNLLLNPVNGSGSLIHYGGDDYGYQNYRRGDLFFYNNTLINIANQSERYRTIIFDLPSDAETFVGATNYAVEEKVTCFNNIFYNEPNTIGATPSEMIVFATDSAATIEMHKNWFSPNVTQHYNYNGFIDSCIGWNNSFHSTTNIPGFQNSASGNYQLLSVGESVDAGENIPLNYLVLDKQYIQTDSFQLRTIQGSALDYGYFEAMNNIALANNLLTLNASQSNKNIILNWQIESIENLTSFSLEHSTDGIHFSEIDVVNVENNKTTYSYLHNSPTLYLNYYRVKSIDVNNKINYSTIKKILFKNTNSSIDIYPNPCKNNLFIKNNNGEMDITSISLFNIFGQIIKINHSQIDVSTLMLNLEKFKSGMYIISIENDDYNVNKIIQIK